ncbi:MULTISPECIES: type III secretion system inner rod subunit SctI [Yersinia]|uniref:type III secretion system inner rod subunit SctI n=1 Tax=Yersinia TaxID=629 RepID=UPI0005DD763C|nr:MULTISPECIES: type III secretion system inner rod subunit SctI [Yersinia]OVZ95769.1 EscI/YscI/HrpB family type III secretion system inner rod protein [Yersinia frederiksenii]RXA94352.1 EscI/YscI/HrpB family type III secretion system inner rod protein [Yersinia sp. 2105 StPb PI]CNI63383.1 putative type III secretion apparatus [Yersinia frederiksenii]CNJ24996.1 putative type III secretion apparatus [Yersinia frederiksenii]CNK66608.1 putative type III secretion apparatus [Yersinia frederikseni
MDIDAIQAVAMQVTPLKPPVDAEQVAKFTQLMQPADPTTSMISPDPLLSLQSELMHATLSIDLTAKVAGVLGQNINKLVNMQ